MYKSHMIQLTSSTNCITRVEGCYNKRLLNTGKNLERYQNIFTPIQANKLKRAFAAGTRDKICGWSLSSK